VRRVPHGYTSIDRFVVRIDTVLKTYASTAIDLTIAAAFLCLILALALAAFDNVRTSGGWYLYGLVSMGGVREEAIHGSRCTTVDKMLQFLP
jgi:hypothetical protein